VDRHATLSAALARPVLHTAHVLTFAVLLATGLLLLLPTLRATLTGGYSLLIRNTHRWGGVACAVLPAAIALYFGARAVFVTPAHRTWRTLWQGAHVGVTLLFGVLFTLTGFVIWWKRRLPEGLVDTSRSVHDGLTYVAIVLVGAHLVEVALAALVGRVQTATAGPAETRNRQA